MSTDILSYIPQRPPFVLIDQVLESSETLSATSFLVPEDHVLLEDGFLSEAGLVENMAQTAAAGTGYKAQQEHKPAPVGYIGALKNLKIAELPAVGETLRTEIRFLHQVMNAHIVEGKVFCQDREIASCELKIFLQIASI